MWINVFVDFLSVATLHGLGKMSCNFTEITKALKFHVVHRLIRYFFTILYNWVLP